MSRLSRGVIAAELAASTFVVGCALQDQPEPNATMKTVTVTPWASAYNRGSHLRPDLLPPVLPTAIANIASRAVLVRLQNIPTVDAHGKPILVTGQGSGVALSNGEYLTAGHAVAHNNALIPAARKCGNLLVDSPTSTPQGGITIGALKTTGTVTSHDDTSPVPDIGIIETGPNFKSMPDIEPLQLSGRAKVGEPVYFVNYEPTAKGEIRTPLRDTLTPDTIADGLNAPAIYGGIVIGYLANGKEVVATGIRSYGKHLDKWSRPGASGGGVFDSSGKLNGLTIVVDNVFTAKEQATLLRLGLLDASSPLQREIIQPVQPKMLRALRIGLTALPSVC